MSAYTKGPWSHLAKLSGSENHKGYRVFSDRDRSWIADVSPIDTDGKEGEANVRLIAAAPDLLEHLSKVVAQIEEYGMCAEPIFFAARDALKKVRGEQ